MSHLIPTPTLVLYNINNQVLVVTLFILIKFKLIKIHD
jgi:hypothetical protein